MGDLELALAAAREAGAIARSMQAGIAHRAKADGSPVTAADLAADAAIRRAIGAARPGDAFLTEEGADDPARLAARRVWIVDPIDGTKEYLKGEEAWAVQVALAVDGALVLGALVMPALGIALAGGPGLGCRLWDEAGERPLHAPPPPGDLLLMSDSARNREVRARVAAALPEMTLLTSGSVGVKVWRMLQGRAAVYIHGRPMHEWDAAAPAAVLAGAGGRASDVAGRNLVLNSPAGLVPGLLFSIRPDHDAIAARLAAAGIAVGP